MSRNHLSDTLDGTERYMSSARRQNTVYIMATDHSSTNEPPSEDVRTCSNKTRRAEPSSPVKVLRLSLELYRRAPAVVNLAVTALVASVVVVSMEPRAALVVFDPILLLLTAPTLVPAVLFTLYIRESRPEDSGDLTTASLTYVLGVLAAGVAYTVNSAVVDPVVALPLVGGATLFLVFVAPIEELLKLAAVRVYAFDRVNALTPLDGIYYGCIATLGFTTVENSLYVLTDGLLGRTGVVESVVGRANVGTLHVFWTATAGYYLGASARSGRAAVAAVGLAAAAGLHAAYNVYVLNQRVIPEILAAWLPLTTEHLQPATTFVVLLALYGFLFVAVEKLVVREIDART